MVHQSMHDTSNEIWTPRRLQIRLTSENSNDFLVSNELQYVLSVLTDWKLIITSESNLVFAALLIQLAHLKFPNLRLHLYLDCERTPHNLVSLFLLQEVKFKEIILILLDRTSYKFDYSTLVKRALCSTEKLSMRFSQLDFNAVGGMGFNDVKSLEFRQCLFDQFNDLDLFLSRCRQLESLSLLSTQDSDTLLKKLFQIDFESQFFKLKRFAFQDDDGSLSESQVTQLFQHLPKLQKVTLTKYDTCNSLVAYLAEFHIGKFENLHINFDELKIEIKALPLN